MLSVNLNRQVISSVTLAAFLTIAAAGYAYYRKQRDSIPKNWTRVGKVKQLFIYPLKSGRKREIQSAECTTAGFKIVENNVELTDRCFVVYGESNNEFKTARTYPKLVLIEPSVNERENIVLTAPGQEPLIVEMPNPDTKPIKVTLHKQESCDALDCGQKAAIWLSQYLLGKPSGLRLGFYNDKYQRNVLKTFPAFQPAYPQLKSELGGHFQDLCSYLLLNQSSLDALNEKSEETIYAMNFRPNIVMEPPFDSEPFLEETWNWVKIGNAVFRNVKPCTRCVFTTVHPENGVFSKAREPLKSLMNLNNLKDPAHIKAEGKSAVMGIYLGLKSLGSISVGDEIYAA